MLSVLASTAASGGGAGGTGLWQSLLVGSIVPLLGLVGWTIRYLRTRGVDKRQEDRHDDILWGYTDAQGRYHTGVIEAYGKRLDELEDARE